MRNQLNIDQIKEKITQYLKNETNYGYLISGEWGAGKTYLLEKELIPMMRDLNVYNSQSNVYKHKYKPIYISLSGIRSFEILKELMFGGVNIGTRFPRTVMDDEIALLDNVMSQPELMTLVEVPQNIVYCFDDLERINPSFIEEALGFINSYIEQKHIKVIFLCDEKVLRERTRDKYLYIKEKYIRFSIELYPNFDNVLNACNNIDDNEKLFIKSIMERGECQNLRTLEFILAVYNEVCPQFMSILSELGVEEKYKNQFMRLFIFYIVFFSIELKKGVPYNSIIKVQSSKRILSFEEQGLHLDLPITPIDSSEEKNRIGKQELISEVEKTSIKQIESLYFEDNDEPFEPFKSIAVFLASSYLSIIDLKNEVSTIYTSILRKEGTEEGRILQIIQNIFELSDETYITEITNILQAVDKGEFSLGTYIQIYSQLLLLESYGISGIDVNESVVSRFKAAMKKALNDGNLEYDYLFMDKYSRMWSESKDLDQTKKFRNLLGYADNINEELPSSQKKVIPFEDIKALVEEGSYSKLYTILVERKWDYLFEESNADDIFQILQKQKAGDLNAFRTTLNERYKLRDGHTVASSEYLFIKRMLELVVHYEENIGDDKPLSYIPLTLMKNNLEECIRYFNLDRGEDKI